LAEPVVASGSSTVQAAPVDDGKVTDVKEENDTEEASAPKDKTEDTKAQDTNI
jgi:hypothetical protein